MFEIKEDENKIDSLTKLWTFNTLTRDELEKFWKRWWFEEHVDQLRKKQ